MKRLTVNLMIDIAMFLSMVLVSVSGWILKGVVLFQEAPVYGRRGPVVIYGLRRGIWRDIHIWAGIVLLVLLVAHIALHWSSISSFFKRNIPNAPLRYAIYLILLVLSALSIFPWIEIMV